MPSSKGRNEHDVFDNPVADDDAESPRGVASAFDVEKKAAGNGSAEMEESPLYRFATSRWFDRAVLVLIMVSSISIALEDPTEQPDQPSARNDKLRQLDKYMMLAFTLEMAIKIGAFGIKKYLKSGWNWLDVVIVGSSWVPYILCACTVRCPQPQPLPLPASMPKLRAMRSIFRPGRTRFRWATRRIYAYFGCSVPCARSIGCPSSGC